MTSNTILRIFELAPSFLELLYIFQSITMIFQGLLAGLPLALRRPRASLQKQRFSRPRSNYLSPKRYWSRRLPKRQY
jgi:hypothetical protein